MAQACSTGKSCNQKDWRHPSQSGKTLKINPTSMSNATRFYYLKKIYSITNGMIQHWIRVQLRIQLSGAVPSPNWVKWSNLSKDWAWLCAWNCAQIGKRNNIIFRDKLPLFVIVHIEMTKNLFVMKGTSNPNTLYEAMKSKDKNELTLGIQKKLNNQFKKRNFSTVNKEKIPKDKITLPAVWA